jgi:hypothetical protein
MRTLRSIIRLLYVSRKISYPYYITKPEQAVYLMLLLGLAGVIFRDWLTTAETKRR